MLLVVWGNGDLVQSRGLFGGSWSRLEGQVSWVRVEEFLIGFPPRKHSSMCIESIPFSSPQPPLQLEEQ